jgi:tetratricopeptide (TPR) repeat protein
VALRGLGAAHLAAGDVERARACAQQAYEVCAEVPDPRIEAEVTHTLAAVRATRDTPAAMELYLRALHLARTAGHRHSEVETLVALAELQQRAGRTEAARGWAAQAAALARSSGYRPLLDRADAVLGRPVHTAPPANERNSH